MILPPIKNHKVPRPLLVDAYTCCSEKFENQDALDFSTYQLAFRRKLIDIDSSLYSEEDNRIVFYGLQAILDELLREPITNKEIDESIAFLEKRKATTAGLANFDFNEEMWRRVVDEFAGRPPIQIEALPEGSVCYPGEPVLRVTSKVKGFGQLCAYFEAVLLHVWATSERVTAARHWYENQLRLIRAIEKGEIIFKDGRTDKGNGQLIYDEGMVHFLSSIRLHDFGARGAICSQESDRLGQAHLLVFSGTDTWKGAYQAWKNGAGDGIGTSVKAHAHRTVSGHNPWYNAYQYMYDTAKDGEILSQVADLVDYRADVAKYLVPLALDAATKKNGKVIVARPDSAKNFEDLLDQVKYTLELATNNKLFTLGANGFKYGTTLKLIVGDSMDWRKMSIMDMMIMNLGWAPHSVCIYGCGGHLRNSIKRDNLSAKYYLSSCGKEGRAVVKLSETSGKRTLPDCIVTRDEESLKTGITLHSKQENVVDAFVTYYDGTDLISPFGVGQYDDFMLIRERVIYDFDKMPWNAGKISKKLEEEFEILKAQYGK
jgi:nicotinamide phosphoribosyltransferase